MHTIQHDLVAYKKHKRSCGSFSLFGHEDVRDDLQLHHLPMLRSHAEEDSRPPRLYGAEQKATTCMLAVTLDLIQRGTNAQAT